ncbi:prepilin-type N-terminal cleavage/methylation domain-containing protein [Patescibacteria group bacterium]|nr:prepilin-type N-terminal cleavage/methylation domain-containing protein [Patescibacteria group bacterium]
MLKCLNVKIARKGFTLIEIIVAVAIFALIVGTISGLFVSAIQSQRRILATQEILNQASYVMEYMGRALRMAKKELNTPPISCLSRYGLNYETTANGLKFIDYNDVCTEFFLDAGLLKKTAEGVTLPLTSTDLQVNSLKFNLLGADQPPADNLQPRVTIFLEIETKRSVPGLPPKILIQTSVSQRNLDVQY